MKQLVDSFSLEKWLGTDEAKAQLTMAGFRGRQAEVAFIFFRAIAPIGLFLFTALYVFLIIDTDWTVVMKLGVSIGGAYLESRPRKSFSRTRSRSDRRICVAPSPTRWT